MRLHSCNMFDWKQDSHSLFFVSSFESIVRYSREYYAVSKLVISDSSTRSNLLNNNIKSPLLVELFSSEVSQPWCMYFGEYTQNLHTLMLLHSSFIFGSSGIPLHNIIGGFDSSGFLLLYSISTASGTSIGLPKCHCKTGSSINSSICTTPASFQLHSTASASVTGVSSGGSSFE